MKAVFVNDETRGIIFKEVESGNLGDKNIKVDIKATALNRADIFQRLGLYPPPKGETEILGLEMAGIVTEKGGNVDKYQVGDHVYSLLPGGGYAEKIVIHQDKVMPMPEGLSFEEAAGIPEAFLTAYMNLIGIADIKTGEYILIHAGASGVGTAAIQIAKERGAIVIVTSSSDKKLNVCRELGADHLINYKSENIAEKVLEITKEGAHVILDFIGASYWQTNIKSIRHSGRWILLGLLGSGKVSNVDLGQILLKNISLIGSTLRSKSNNFKIQLSNDFTDYSKLKFSSGEFKAVIDSVFNWKAVNESHKYMEENRNIGKIILKIDG